MVVKLLKDSQLSNTLVRNMLYSSFILLTLHLPARQSFLHFRIDIRNLRKEIWQWLHARLIQNILTGNGFRPNKIIDALQFFEENGEVFYASRHKGEKGIKETQESVADYLSK